MKSICKLIALSFLIVVTSVFNTGFAYGVNISSPISNFGAFDGVRMVSVKEQEFPNGSKITEIIVKPSLTGAIVGATGGATVGSLVCTTSVIAAPSAPLCGAVGALIGGTVGLVFGPKDD